MPHTYPLAGQSGLGSAASKGPVARLGEERLPKIPLHVGARQHSGSSHVLGGALLSPGLLPRPNSTVVPGWPQVIVPHRREEGEAENKPRQSAVCGGGAAERTLPGQGSAAAAGREDGGDAGLSRAGAHCAGLPWARARQPLPTAAGGHRGREEAPASLQGFVFDVLTRTNGKYPHALLLSRSPIRP